MAISATTTVYGIPNCDTVKAAGAWLHTHGIAHDFHDYKKHGVPQPQLHAWIASVGWTALVNRRGTTWRQLDAAQQAALCDAASAHALMCAHPSLIRRPVLAHAGGLLVGFELAEWARAFAR